MNRLLEFLKESNAIEGVYDAQSLVDAEAAWQWLESHKLTIANILKAHAILMKNQSHIAEFEKGAFRMQDVLVGNVPVLLWREVPSAMKEWLEAPYKDAKTAHIYFEKIHPFIDGNGRIGRMIMNWQRIKIDGLSGLIIKASEKQKYYDWFR